MLLAICKVAEEKGIRREEEVKKGTEALKGKEEDEEK